MKTNIFISLVWLLILPAALPATLVNDRRIETLARASYIYRTVLEDRVKVSAEFGVLTLTGSVEDQADRMLAEDTARTIPWVAEIENKIILLPSCREQSDPWIGLKVLARLRMRTMVNADTTRVAVRDGLVTLSGTVRDDSQKERTGLIATEIAGVNQVHNNLVVAPPPSGEAALAEQIDDASITAMISAALRGQEATRTLAARITAAEGTVRITGEAGSEAQKSLVTQLAREVHGVRFVTNAMKNPK